MKHVVTVSAPGKLMLFGEHAVVYDHPCIVTAIDQRLQVTISENAEAQLIINAPDVNVRDYKRPIDKLGKTAIPKGAQFVEIAIKNFSAKYPLRTGISITTSSQFKSTFGFGSSSASAVCVVKALSELYDVKLSNKDIFDIAYKTVLDVQGKGSGFDVASAIYGGTLYFVTGGKTIEQITSPCHCETKSKQSHKRDGHCLKTMPFIIAYSGIKADTVSLIEKVAEKAQREPDLVESIYNSIELIVDMARVALEDSSWEETGKLMNENQVLLQQLEVSSQKLDTMISAANNAGAFGAKLSGAGGGDCMIALSAEDKLQGVKNAIEKAGGQVIDISTNADGVRVEN